MDVIDSQLYSSCNFFFLFSSNQCDIFLSGCLNVLFIQGWHLWISAVLNQGVVFNQVTVLELFTFIQTALYNSSSSFFSSRDSFDFPSYPQSFDIAVSPGISRNSKSQGKGDRSRREKCVTFTYLPFRVVFNPLTPRSKV